jgi:hypothetical protein
MPSIEQASRWKAQLAALCATLPPAQDRTADEYTTVLRHLDTDRQTAAMAVVFVPDGIDFPGLYRLADQLAAETVRRRWLLILNDTLMTVAANAVVEAERRDTEADEGDLGFARSFAEGAQFVLSALREVMNTDNTPGPRYPTLTYGGGGSGVDAAPGNLAVASAEPIGPGMGPGGGGTPMQAEHTREDDDRD